MLPFCSASKHFIRRTFTMYIFTVILLRLVSLTNSLSSGRVEVSYNGIWGTICDDSWDLRDADVVCGQLGYDGASSAAGGAAFGRGTGQIWLDDVQCVGNETSISQCDHRGWGVENCRHSEDAGVVCKLKGRETIRILFIVIFTKNENIGNQNIRGPLRIRQYYN